MKLQDVIRVYNAGYASGHHETVEGGHVDILTCDMDSYHKEEVLTLMAELGIENPEDLRYQRDELIEALSDFWASETGQPKLCGHDFDCICPGDRVKDLLARCKVTP